MTSIQETIGYNNVGVALLEMGSICEARELFSLAIEGMKGVIDTRLVERCTSSTSALSCAAEDAAVEASVTAISPPPTTASVLVEPSPNHQMHQSQRAAPTPNEALHPSSIPAIPPTCTSSVGNGSRNLYDFLRPIYISEDEFLINNAPLVKLTISLLFNLAITDHAIAMTIEEGGTQDQLPSSKQTITTAANAIFLYQLAYCLQVKDGIELSRIHTMGMINNVGRLLAFLGDEKECEKCFKHLLKKLMVQSVEESYGGGVVPGPVSPTGAKEHHEELGQLEGFLNNIMAVVLRDTLSSPAA